MDASGCPRKRATSGRRTRSRKTSATTISSAAIRASAIWFRATSRRAPPKKSATRDAAWGPSGQGVYLDFADAIQRLGRDSGREKYGNLFDIYEEITGEDAYTVPMRIYPAPHYTMGGLWVDYHLMTTIPGLFAGGEANFSDHGANRLGASALMQGLADGYFILPATVPNYIASNKLEQVDTSHPGVRGSPRRESTSDVETLISIGGKRTADSFHKELGRLMWDECGMARSRRGPARSSGRNSGSCARSSGAISGIVGTGEELNQSLEKAARRCRLSRTRGAACASMRSTARESCGGHFRVESQTPDGEAMRDDEDFSYVSAWEWKGDGEAAGTAQGAAGVRARSPRSEELQVDHESHTQSLAAAEREALRANS